MDNELTETRSSEVSDFNKKNWIADISVKLVDNKPFTRDEINFMANMCRTESNARYGEFLKQMSINVMRRPEFYDAEMVIDNLHKNLALQTNLFRATEQTRKDAAATQNINYNLFNKFSKKLAQKEAEKVIENHPSSERVNKR